MRKKLLFILTLVVLSVNLSSCVETCEGECDIDENGNLDCPCDN